MYEMTYRGEKIKPEKRIVRHIIEKCDMGAFIFDIHIKGVQDGNVWDSIRKCCGRLQKKRYWQDVAIHCRWAKSTL